VRFQFDVVHPDDLPPLHIDDLLIKEIRLRSSTPSDGVAFPLGRFAGGAHTAPQT